MRKKHLSWNLIFKLMEKLGHNPTEEVKRFLKKQGKFHAYKHIYALIKKKPLTEKLSKLKHAMSVLCWQGTVFGEIADFEKFKKEYIYPFIHDVEN